MSDRRQQLAVAATDHALEHGLIGLSLRPLAAAIGTSDRMLLYHFRDKDDLVATILRTSNDRSVADLAELDPSPDPERAIHDLWAVADSPGGARCQRLYVEAAALGVLGREPYASVVAEANGRWLSALAQHLSRSGMSAGTAARAAVLVDATFMGLQLDQQLDDGATARRTIADLAHAVATLRTSART